MATIGRARKIYAALMALTGAMLALAIHSHPPMATWRISPVMMLIAISLLIDVALLWASSTGRSDLLDMNGRLIGFFAGVALYVIVALTLSGGGGVAF
jgi:hypothetical protein